MIQGKGTAIAALGALISCAFIIATAPTVFAAEAAKFASPDDFVVRCGGEAPSAGSNCTSEVWSQNWLLSFEGSSCEARNKLVSADGVRKIVSWLKSNPAAASPQDPAGVGSALKALAPC